jgi:hypothetical protein
MRVPDFLRSGQYVRALQVQEHEEHVHFVLSSISLEDIVLLLVDISGPPKEACRRGNLRCSPRRSFEIPTGWLRFAPLERSGTLATHPRSCSFLQHVPTQIDVWIEGLQAWRSSKSVGQSRQSPETPRLRSVRALRSQRSA